MTIWPRLAGLAWLAMLSLAAHAQEPAEIDTRIERLATTYELRDDGAATTTYHFERRILTQRAVEDAKRAEISYSTSIQTAEVVEAATRKADGRVLRVPRGNYQIETNTGKDAASPLFSDETEMTLVFPDVAVGDLIVLTYRIRDKEPMFPGRFSVAENFPRSLAIDEARVRIVAPKTLWSQFNAHDLEQVTDREEGGRRILEWRFSNPTPMKSKRTNFSVYEVTDEPGIEYSTFHSNREIAEAYGARALPKALPSARIRALAAQIVADKSDPHDEAKALYEWVATHIHYAGNCVGLGAVVPHDTDLVLDNKLGDCKDHATLLQALLAARGIVSTQALINAGSSYRLSPVPVVSMVNHVITYIPAWDLFLDSTSDSTPFGMLPEGDQGKPVLLVEHYREGAQSPVPAVAANAQTINSVIHVLPDGTMHAEVAVDLNGNLAVGVRSGFRQISRQNEEDWAKSIAGVRQEGSVHVEHDDAQALTDHFHLRFDVEKPDFVTLPGPGAFGIRPPAAIGYTIAYLVASESAADDTVDTVCSGGTVTERYEYDLPDGVDLLAAPKDFTLDSGPLSFAATYVRQANQLLITRVLTDRSAGPLCSAEANAAKKGFYKRVGKHLAAQVLYS